MIAFIHNYGKTSFNATDIQSFKIDANGNLSPIEPPDLRILHLDGTEYPEIKSGDTVIVNATAASIDCTTGPPPAALRGRQPHGNNAMKAIIAIMVAACMVPFMVGQADGQGAA